MSSVGVTASGSTEITVAAPVTTPATAAQILAAMAVLSGVLTDYNSGSQIRTMAEAQGSVNEMQGIWAQAQAFQALIYGALSLFNIQPGQAVAATGIVSFQTAQSGTLPPASQSVPIPAGTIVQTNGGIQYVTTVAAVLIAGATSINVAIQAVTPGSAGNTPIGSVVNIVSGLNYPLFVTNAAAIAGGADAPPLSSSLAQFAALVASIGLSTPLAIADAAIGVTFGAETCQYSTVYEPWIAAGTGVGSGTAGWNLIIDNGLGTASSGLVNAVNNVINGGTVNGASNASGPIGYRDAGVPYNILAVTGVAAAVGVSGTLANVNNAVVVANAISAAVSGYFVLPFGTPAEQAQLSASVANSVAGQLTSLVVSLAAASGGGSVATLLPSASGRIYLGSIALNLVSGS